MCGGHLVDGAPIHDSWITQDFGACNQGEHHVYGYVKVVNISTDTLAGFRPGGVWNAQCLDATDTKPIWWSPAKAFVRHLKVRFACCDFCGPLLPESPPCIRGLNCMARIFAQRSTDIR